MSISPEVINNLREFRGQSKLKKAALNILVKMMNPNDLSDLRQEFQKIDTDHSGLIEFKELEKALKNSNIKLDYDEIDQIIKELDYDGNEMINYSEFLAATISIKKILTHEKLLAVFNHFDESQTNQITAQNIVSTLKKMGRDISLQEI